MMHVSLWVCAQAQRPAVRTGRVLSKFARRWAAHFLRLLHIQLPGQVLQLAVPTVVESCTGCR